MTSLPHTLTVRLPADLAEGLAALAQAEQIRSGLPVTPSALVRRALLRELRAAGDEQPPPDAQPMSQTQPFNFRA